MANQAEVTFSNVELVESCHCTLSHGITPSRTVLRILPQRKAVQTEGPLVLKFDKTKIILTNCLADENSIQRNQSGETVSLTILDRRWQWRHKTISGHYNFRDANGDIYKDTADGVQKDPKLTLSDCERTPHELIELCLGALGERDPSIQGAPGDLRPEVHWEDDNAAQALQSLCDICGLRVVLALNDRIMIQPIGVGNGLPLGLVESYDSSIDPADLPEGFRIVGAPNWYQVDLELEAVGLERNGDIKPIDELSYKPADGWTEVEPVNLEEVVGDEDRALARASIYRLYRVKMGQVIYTPEGQLALSYTRQIEIMPVQVYTRKVLGRVEHLPAIVWGDFYDQDSGFNTSDVLGSVQGFDLKRSVVDQSPQIIGEQLLVSFGSPVWKQDDDNQAIPAKLKLRTAVQIREADTGEYGFRHAYHNQRTINAHSQSGYRVFQHPEMRVYYNTKGKAINEADMDRLASQYHHSYEKEYVTEKGETAIYSGWVKVSPDGALQSVTWSMDGSGVWTVVQRNSDRGSRTTNAYKLRRLWEQYSAAVRQAVKMGKDTRKGWNEEHGIETPVKGLFP